ncbi:MAG TPA: hypothetical protein VH481_09145 [Nitrososphaeraceae archaeon]|jgi:hypothetical protein
MDTKLVIFVIISALLTAAFYSSSVPHVSATIYCSHKKGANYEICKNIDTQIYKICKYPEQFPSGGGAQIGCSSLNEDLPTDLKKALDDELLIDENIQVPQHPPLPDVFGGLNNNVD